VTFVNSFFGEILMPNLPSGTGQIVISGVSQEIIDEFKSMCAPQGNPPRRRKTWDVFEQVWKEWKAFKAQSPQSRLALGDADVGESESVQKAAQALAQKDAQKTRRKDHG
jgi:hypothetical protein